MSPVIETSPVISTPLLVTLNRSVLFTNVFTSLDVPKVMYSCEPFVPIFVNELLISDVILVCAPLSVNAPLEANDASPDTATSS